MNQKISLSPKQLLAWLRQARKLLTVLALAILLGYVGYQASQLTAIQPNQGYMALQQKTNKVPNLRSSKAVITELQQLQSPGDTTIQVTTGKQNPFTLN